MQCKILRFHKDEKGDWIVDLDCGHSRHMRHDPPWSNMDWIHSSEARWDRMQKPIECTECDGKGKAFVDLKPEIEEATTQDPRDLQVAAAVKAACLKEAIEIYQEALSGKLSVVEAAEKIQKQIANLDIAEIIAELLKKERST
ncbi:MAG: DUF3565 domain-containing protein [Calditrichota bacterium]